MTLSVRSKPKTRKEYFRIKFILVNKGFVRSFVCNTLVSYRKGNKEVRHIVEVAELIEKNKQIKCNTLFEYDYSKRKLVRKGKSTKVFEKAKQGFCFERKEFEKEIEHRAGILAGMQCSKIAMKEFFEKINNFEQ